jgi:hypothetical protein
MNMGLGNQLKSCPWIGKVDMFEMNSISSVRTLEAPI